MRRNSFLILMAFLLVGFSRSFHIQVNSFSAVKDIYGGKYVVLSGLKNISEEDLEFKEYARYISNALNKKGMTLVKDKNSAGIAIMYSYGIDDSQTSYVPRAENVLTPHGVVGTATGYMPMTNYIKYVTVAAYDMTEFRKNGGEKQLWKIEMTNPGGSNDLRKTLPYLIAAGMPYFGKSTGKIVRVNIPLNSEEVLDIEGSGRENN